MFGNILKQYRKKLRLWGQWKELTDRSGKEPDNLDLQARLGDLLTKMGKKEEAIILYRRTAENFSQKCQFSEAMAFKKGVMRLDPSEVNYDRGRKSYKAYDRVG